MFALALGIEALGSALPAQVRQYTPPGGSASESAHRKEAFAEAVEQARWHLGDLRIDPAIWIADLAWVDRSGDNTSGDSNSDLTGRAGAGLRAYLPVGSKTTVAAYALPEYVWWKERADDRRLNQRFGLGTFTYFNRLAVEASAERNEDFDYATGEVLARYTSRTERLGLALEVPLFRQLTLFARGEQSRVRSLVDGESDPALASFFSGLDRDEISYRGGLRYYLRERLRFGAGVGHSESDFEPGALDRSNSGDFWYVEMGYERPKLTVEVHYQENQLAAVDGSGFTDFDDSTAAARIGWRPRETFGMRLYATRQLAYSLLVSDSTAYVDEIAGLGFDVAIGWRMRFDAFLESGTHSYVTTPSSSPNTREDDVTNLGAELRIELRSRMSLRVGYRERRITPPEGSGFPEQNSSEILANLGFGAGKGTWY